MQQPREKCGGNKLSEPQVSGPFGHHSFELIQGKDYGQHTRDFLGERFP